MSYVEDLRALIEELKKEIDDHGLILKFRNAFSAELTGKQVYESRESHFRIQTKQRIVEELEKIIENNK